MAQKIEVLVAETARRDLAEIAEFIQLDSPRAGRKLIREIHDRLKQLPSFPRLGRMIPEIGDPSLREIIAGPYRLMYRLEPERIILLRALHGRRSFSGEL